MDEEKNNGEKYLCEIGEEPKCVKDTDGKFVEIEECRKFCLEQFNLSLPLYAETNIAYSPFWYLAGKIFGVNRIKIRYPFPTEYTTLLEDKKTDLYKEFTAFIENKDNKMEKTFSFISKSSYDSWLVINKKLFGDVNTYDYPLTYHSVQGADLENSVIANTPPTEIHDDSYLYKYYVSKYRNMKSFGDRVNYIETLNEEGGIYIRNVPDIEKIRIKRANQFSEWFKNALSKKREISIIKISVKYPREKHANMLIINPIRKILYYVEPHGNKYERILAFVYGIQIMFSQELKEGGWKWQFNEIKLQGINGLCALWVSLCLGIALKNPGMDSTAFMYDMLLEKNKRFKLTLLIIWVFYISQMTDKWIEEESKIDVDRECEKEWNKWKDENVEYKDKDYTQEFKEEIMKLMDNFTPITLLMEVSEKRVKDPNHVSKIQDKSFVQLIKDFDMGVALGEAKE